MNSGVGAAKTVLVTLLSAHITVEICDTLQLHTAHNFNINYFISNTCYNIFRSFTDLTIHFYIWSIWRMFGRAETERFWDDLPKVICRQDHIEPHSVHTQSTAPHTVEIKRRKNSEKITYVNKIKGMETS